MEPLIADGGIVLADLSHNDIRHISAIFVEFARQLQKLNAAYKVKIYNKWVEIINSNSTKTKSAMKKEDPAKVHPKALTAKARIKKGGKDVEST